MDYRLTAIRHAPIPAAGRCIGRSDLAPELPAAAAADRILAGMAGGPAPGVVWSSSLRRCREPAALVAARLGVAHRIDDRLLELDYGDWDGASWKDIEAHSPDRLAAWMADWQRAAPPGGETVGALEGRVRSFWTENERSRRETAEPTDELLVAHAGVIRALWVVVDGLPWEQAMARAVPHLEPEGPFQSP